MIIEGLGAAFIVVKCLESDDGSMTAIALIAAAALLVLANSTSPSNSQKAPHIHHQTQQTQSATPAAKGTPRRV